LRLLRWPLFFQLVHHRRGADMQHPRGIPNATAIESPVDDAIFDRRGTTFIGEIERKGIMRTVGIVALVTLLADWRLPPLMTWSL